MSLTLIIIIVTSLISYQAFSNQGMSRKLHHSPFIESREKQYFRLLTSGFLHGGWGHLLVNMFVLYFFGEKVEQIFSIEFGLTMGRLNYVLLYIFSIIGANLATYFKHRNNPSFASLGASGAVSAVVFASILFAPWDCLYLYGIVPIQGIIGGILYLGWSTWASKNRRDHVDHDAHLWGAIFGFVFTIILNPEFFSSFLAQLTHPRFCPWPI